MASVIELLLQMLKNLYHSEIIYLMHELSSQDRNYRMLMTLTDTEDAVFLIVKLYGQQSVMKIRAVFRQMRKTDLMQKLSVTSLIWKEKHPSALIYKVATMAAVTELLLETLSCLRNEELITFKWLLQFTCFQKRLPVIPWKNLDFAKTPQIVHVMVDTYGLRSVEVTMEVLTDMNRTDLILWLSESSSGLKEASADTFDVKTTEEESCSALSQKVESMVAALHLLLEALADFGDREIKVIKGQLLCLEDDVVWRLPPIPDIQHTVFFIALMFGQQSVEKTKELLEKMKMTDFVKRLSDGSLAARKEPPMDTHRSALIHKVATVAAFKELLLETLSDFSDEDFKKFRYVLHENVLHRNVLHKNVLQNNIFCLASVLTAGTDKKAITTQMMETFGQTSVEVTKKIFMNMKNPDMLEKLLEPRLRSRVKHTVPEKDRASLESEVTNRFLGCVKNCTQFKWLLQFMYFQNGLPLFPWEKCHCTPGDLVTLIKDRHGQQWVEVTRNILNDMKRTDPRESLSEISSEERWKTIMKEGQMLETPEEVLDPNDWTQLSPEVNNSHADEAPTHSLQSEAGNFECSVSGLRWVCKDKVSFKYQFCSWDEHMQRMEIRQYMPAGPLIDIIVAAGTLNEVYLPHWICVDDNPAIVGVFAALHIDDCGDAVEIVSEVTSSHIKLSEPIFSPRAALMKFGIPVKISCNVLIYYKPNTTFLKLHVYLIPNDPALQQAVDKEESTNGFEMIRKPRPDQYLKMSQRFTLTANTATAEIIPEKLTLRYDSQDPNFYEVYIKNPDKNVFLSLSYPSEKKSKQKCEPVWTCEIRQDDYSNTGLSEAAGSLSGNAAAPEPDKLCSALIQEPDEMIIAVRERLLEMLENLKLQEFENFKWHLNKCAKEAGLPCISPSKLEKANMLNLVELMVQTYCEKAVDMTKEVFKKINRNDLVMIL